MDVNEHLLAVFIGSSTEGLDVAREVELQLQRDAITTIWKDGVFGLGSGTLESLMKIVEQFDCGPLVVVRGPQHDKAMRARRPRTDIAIKIEVKV